MLTQPYHLGLYLQARTGLLRADEQGWLAFHFIVVLVSLGFILYIAFVVNRPQTYEPGINGRP